MNHTPDIPNSLQACNDLMGPMEQHDIVRAATFAHAGRHMAAECIRVKRSYSRDDCNADTAKRMSR